MNPGQLQQAAEHARQLGFISSSDLAGMVDDALLREVMGAQGPPAPRDPDGVPGDLPGRHTNERIQLPG